MNKRIKSLITACAVAVSSVFAAVPAYAAGTDGLSLSATTVSPGDTFTVTLEFPSVTAGFTAAEWGEEFDTSVFEVTNVDYPDTCGKADVIPAVDQQFDDDDEHIKELDSYETINKSGDIHVCILDAKGADRGKFAGFSVVSTLKVKAGAAVGSYDIKLTGLTVVQSDNTNVAPTTFTDKVTVKVETKPVPATAIKLNKDSLALAAGASETLTATLTPTDSTDKVTWKSSDEKVATVDADGKVTAVSVGEATITATANATVSAEAKVTVTCAHATVIDVAATEPTCTEPGLSAHKKCKDCGEIVGDKPTEIPALGHKGGEADCTNQAVCSVCNKPYGDLGDHKYGDLIEEVAAKCGVDGVKAHYECSVCKKLFDESKKEVTAADLKIEAEKHEEKADYTTDADNHWKVCTKCGEVIDGTKAAHNFIWKADTPATTEAAGVKHEECTVCGLERSKGTVIEKLDHEHDMSEVAAKEATCTEDGNVAHFACSVCEKAFLDKDGLNELKDVTVKALGHDFSKYEFNKLTHWAVCSRCDEKDLDNAADHTFGDDGKCTVCGYDKNTTHQVTAGGNSSVTAGSSADLSFKLDGSLDKLVKIFVDGEEVSADNYKATADGTGMSLELKASFIASLSTGAHTLKVEFTDGDASTTFNITPSTEPITGGGVPMYPGPASSSSSTGGSTSTTTTKPSDTSTTTPSKPDTSDDSDDVDYVGDDDIDDDDDDDDDIGTIVSDDDNDTEDDITVVVGGKDEANPITGVALPIAIAVLSLSAGTAVVTSKKRRK